MENVQVEKSRLLSTLQENQRTHEDDFELAWKAFKTMAVHNFEERLKQLKNLKKGEQISLYVNLQIPENHSADYQRAIQMLDWEVDETVELTEQEFQQFVQDDWHWKGQVAQANAFYTGSPSPSKLKR